MFKRYGELMNYYEKITAVNKFKKWTLIVLSVSYLFFIGKEIKNPNVLFETDQRKLENVLSSVTSDQIGIELLKTLNSEQFLVKANINVTEEVIPQKGFSIIHLPYFEQVAEKVNWSGKFSDETLLKLDKFRVSGFKVYVWVSKDHGTAFQSVIAEWVKNHIKRYYFRNAQVIVSGDKEKVVAAGESKYEAVLKWGSYILGLIAALFLMSCLSDYYFKLADRWVLVQHKYSLKKYFKFKDILRKQKNKLLALRMENNRLYKELSGISHLWEMALEKNRDVQMTNSRLENKINDLSQLVERLEKTKEKQTRLTTETKENYLIRFKKLEKQIEFFRKERAELLEENYALKKKINSIDSESIALDLMKKDSSVSKIESSIEDADFI